MDLSIVIVTWNNEHEIGPCLRSVFSCAEGLKCEVYVVDNASTDGTHEVIETAVDPGVRLDDVKITTIWNDKNMGFAAAVDQGLAESKGEFVLLLNPDTVVKPGSLKTMVKYLRDHPDVGIAGGKVLNTDGTIQPSIRRFPSSWDQAVILLKMHNFFPKAVAGYFCDDFNYEVEQGVDQLRGAYFWVSRKLIEKIGNLDAKNFFNWFEEVDYCFRAHSAGYKVMYVPSSSATHTGGASFGQALSLAKQRWFNRSLRNYFKKHGTALDVIVVTVLSPVSLCLAYMVQRFKIKPKKYV